MRILLSTRNYFPIVGGTTVLSRVLADAFTRMGHEVMIVTRTAAAAAESPEPFKVLRFPTAMELWKLSGWADINFQVETSLKFCWPFFLRGKPVVTSHHTHCGGRIAMFQKVLTRWTGNISISQMIYEEWGSRGVIIPNTYSKQHFYRSSEAKEVDLLFVGRLVEDKGYTDLLEALKRLKARGITPLTQFIGEGYEEEGLVSERCQRSVDAAGMKGQVQFIGAQSQEACGNAMRKARILVVPSRWAEPFGMVGLEGLASGCRVVASKQGGLVEALGPHAIWFENGDVSELTQALEAALSAKSFEPEEMDLIDRHLETFSLEAIAQRYLNYFESQIDRCR